MRHVWNADLDQKIIALYSEGHNLNQVARYTFGERDVERYRGAIRNRLLKLGIRLRTLHEQLRLKNGNT